MSSRVELNCHCARSSESASESGGEGEASGREGKGREDHQLTQSVQEKMGTDEGRWRSSDTTLRIVSIVNDCTTV